MIHRLTWLVAGACLGISGYRRAGRMVREIARPRTARQPGGLAEFARDVREGMELYEQRQRGRKSRQVREGPTLGVQHAELMSGRAGGWPASGNGSSAP